MPDGRLSLKTAVLRVRIWFANELHHWRKQTYYCAWGCKAEYRLRPLRQPRMIRETGEFVSPRVRACPACAKKGELMLLALPTPPPSYDYLKNAVEHYRSERNRWRDRAKRAGWKWSDVEVETDAG